MTAALLPTWSLTLRELKRFYRQRSRVVGSLGTPIIFWILLGSGLQAAFPNVESGRNFLQYFFPGNLILTVLFTAIFSNISIIEDRHQGFLQSVLVAPVPRGAIVGGKTAGGGIIALIQGLLFLALAPLAGISFDFPHLLMAVGAIAVVSFTLTIMGFVFAWRFDSVQGFHAIMNLVLMPMWLLSGAFFPIERAPVWLKPLMLANPLTYGFTALKQALFPSETMLFSYATAIAAHLAFGFVFYLVASVLITRQKDSV